MEDDIPVHSILHQQPVMGLRKKKVANTRRKKDEPSSGSQSLFENFANLPEVKRRIRSIESEEGRNCVGAGSKKKKIFD
jgi:hypothetical protein